MLKVKITRFAVFLATCVFIFSVEADGDSDPGIRDTISVQSVKLSQGAESFSLDVTLFNDEYLGGVSVPLTWDSSYLICDSISFAGSRIEYLAYKGWEINNASRQLQGWGAVVTESTIPLGDGIIFTVHFSVESQAPDHVANVVSMFYPPATTFVLALPHGALITPEFISGIITVGDPVSIGDDNSGSGQMQPWNVLCNYPNPFNPQTTIEYALPYDSHVTLEIYDIAGRLMRTLLNEYKDAGYGQVTWDGTNASGQAVASGLYFYTIHAGGHFAAKKMTLLR